MNVPKNEHPVVHFRELLTGLGPDGYPAGVVPLPDFIDGTAFFSAGPGLVCDAPPSVVGYPPFPFGGVMFVGNNLDAEGPYRRRLESGVPHGDLGKPMRTWRNLYRLLDDAGVDRYHCFFTNAYVGLVAGDSPIGRFPGATDALFAQWCERFLRIQIATMRPRVVVAIGGDARRFLARISEGLRDWATSPSNSIHRIRVGEMDVDAVALAHPSMYPVSAKGRAFAGSNGVQAEAALLRAASELVSG